MGKFANDLIEQIMGTLIHENRNARLDVYSLDSCDSGDHIHSFRESENNTGAQQSNA